MPFLSKKVADDFNRRDEENKGSKGSSPYLNAGDIPDKGALRVTPLGDESVTGFIVWTQDGNDRGKKLKMVFSEEPTLVQTLRHALMSAVHCSTVKSGPLQFFGMFVYNYEAECVQYFEMSQKSLTRPFVESMSEEEVAADPHAFDFKLTADRSGDFPKYNLMALPGWRRKDQYADKIDAEWAKIKDTCNVHVALTGGDVFKGTDF